VHPLILTNPARNTSSFLTITGKSHVQPQVAAFFCEGIMYPEQEYSQQTYLLYWLLDGEMGLPSCPSQNEIGRNFRLFWCCSLTCHNLINESFYRKSLPC